VLDAEDVMRMRTFKRLALHLAIGVCATLLGCKHAPPKELTPLEPYVPAAGAVGFDIFPLESSDGTQNWLATCTDDGGNAKFRIALDQATTSTVNGVSTSSGQGKFLPEFGSDSLKMLQNLQAALQAKHMPKTIERVEVLPFEYVILGENQTRSPDDTFRGTPEGNWTATKISLRRGEVFLNINPTAHKAEFSIKDPAYGDAVLAQLAKVL